MYGLAENESIVAFITASGEAYASLSGKEAVCIGTDRCSLVWNQPIQAFKGRLNKIIPLSTLVCQRLKIRPTLGLYNQLMEFEKADELMVEIQDYQANQQRSKVARSKNELGLVNFGEGWRVDYNPPEPSDDELYRPDSDMEADDNDDNDNNKDNDEDGIKIVTEKTNPELN